MDFKEQLESIFLKEIQIPEEFLLKEQIVQREYLSNGEMKNGKKN